jgi:regulator of protease activity HflC (stomatin/prohibitin superfamily)
VDGVIYISVVNSERASYGITDYRFGAIQLAQTTVRSVIGLLEMDTTFEERDLINTKIVEVLDKASDGWGIRVHRYEVKNIVPPETVSRAMEQQMSAERERRAMIATAEGDRDSRVNRSEGQKTELINTSEGEKQRRINEAQGRAREIESVANATSEAIEKLADAIQQPGGDEAVRLRLTEQYFTKLATIGKSDTSVLLPADLSRPEALLEGLGIGVEKK